MKASPITAALSIDQKALLFKALGGHSGRTLRPHAMPAEQAELDAIIEILGRALFAETRQGEVDG